MNGTSAIELLDGVFLSPDLMIEIRHIEPTTYVERLPGCQCNDPDRTTVGLTDLQVEYLTYAFLYHISQIGLIKLADKEPTKSCIKQICVDPVPSVIFQKKLGVTRQTHLNVTRRLETEGLWRTFAESAKKHSHALSSEGFGRVICNSHHRSIHSYSIKNFLSRSSFYGGISK